MDTIGSQARLDGRSGKDAIMEAVLGLVIFIADLWAIVKTLQSPATTGIKLIWVLIIFLLPVIGLILWYFLGPKAAAGQ